MKFSTYMEMVETAHKKKCETFTKKTSDYATEDVLSNFKRIALIARALSIDVTCPADCALYMLVHKLDRIQNLRSKGKEPSNEPLDDSLLDAHVYLDLFTALLKEK